MTRIAGRALHSKARALSELIRVTSRLLAPTGCTRRDEANVQLRFHGARCAALLAIAREVHDQICVMSSHLAAHRCDARLPQSGNVEQQLRVRIFRFRIVGAAPSLSLKGLRSSAPGLGLRHRVACCHPARLPARRSGRTEVVNCDARLCFSGQRRGD